jgi:hypothetical protein
LSLYCLRQVFDTYFKDLKSYFHLDISHNLRFDNPTDITVNFEFNLYCQTY